MSTGKAYPLGPFKKGMVNVSEMTEIDDDQVALAMNFDVDLDGAFTSRPAIIPDHYSPVMSMYHAYTHYATNPACENAGPATDLRYNLCEAPNGVQLSWWDDRWFGPNGGGTHQVIYGDSPVGAHVRKTWTNAPDHNGNTGFSVGSSLGDKYAVSPGFPHVWSGYLRTNASGKPAQAKFQLYNSGGGLIEVVGGTIVNLTPNVWARISVMIPSMRGDAAYAMLILDVDSGPAWQVGQYLDGTGGLFENGIHVGNYFDGGYGVQGELTYSYMGASNASVTVLRGYLTKGTTGAGGQHCVTWRTSNWGYLGPHSIALWQPPAISSTDNFVDILGMLPLAPNGNYKISFTMRSDNEIPIGTPIFRYSVGGSADVFSGAERTYAAGEVFRVEFPINTGPNPVAGFVRLMNGVDIPGNYTYYDMILCCEANYTGGYFDGGTPPVPDPLGGNAISYAYAGTPGDSISRMYLPNLGSQEAINPLGYYINSAGKTFLVCTTTSKTWLYDIDLKTFLEIAAWRASDFCQYDNKVVLIAETGYGGYWEAGVLTSTPSMPLGTSIVLYQERLWAFGAKGTANATRVWFSNITSAGSTPTSIWNWTVATDFFEVNKGDGQWITGLMADVNALIIFRSGSTFRFTYPSNPFSGSLVEVSSVIGADNLRSFVQFESYYLVFNQNRLYQFVNYQFYSLNEKRITFEGEATPQATRYTVRISLFGNRCIVWYRGATYVYNIVTAAWTMWRSVTSYAGHFLQIPQSSLADGVAQALAITGIESGPLSKVYRVRDAPLAVGDGEQMTCMIRTKSYNVEESAQHKRMFYWAMEVRTANGVRGIAYPSALPSQGITWDEMSTHTWDELSLGSWDNPLVIQPTFASDVDFPVAAPVRVIVKAGQDSYFLRMSFDVYLETKGTLATAPAKIYGITPYVRIGAGLSKQVS